MRIGDIGTVDCNDWELEQKLIAEVEKLPMFKDRELTLRACEAIANAYMKKYNFSIPIIYWSRGSFVAGISHGTERLTTIYALSLKQFFHKVVLFCYTYAKQKRLK